MKIFVLGYKGMLGRYVYTYLRSRGHEVIGLGRESMDVEKSTYNESILRSLLSSKGVKKDDVVINCIGIIKSVTDKHSTLSSIQVNTVFPLLLSNVCEKEGIKMIHITTDCAFSGLDGNYNEKSLHDCTDVYGKTKSLGEPTNCTVIRTSVIGDEVNTTRSLISWIKSMKDKTANGYINHRWNGLTCLELSKVYEDIIVNNKYWQGVHHIFSPFPLNKYDLVRYISEIYRLNVNVIPVETPIKCDRTLSTIYDSPTFKIPFIMTQIFQQHDYYPTLISDI